MFKFILHLFDKDQFCFKVITFFFTCIAWFGSEKLSFAQEKVTLDKVLVVAPKAEIINSVTERLPSLTAESKVTAEDIETFNAVNIEDTMRYMPNLFVRKRFIGDPNGVFSIRGNSNFQTARHMVFVDGFPLHNLLQSRFNGAPRWSIVSPDEVLSTRVIYGPFSSAFSGNAMGGVVNIATKQPQKREVVFKQDYFFQDYELFGINETYHGYKSHFSYGDKVGKLSYYIFYDRLQNDGHPQTIRSDTGSFDAGSTETVVSGAYRNENVSGTDQIVYGDNGSEKATLDLFKIKGRYEFNNSFSFRTIVAYQNRDRERDGVNNFLRDANGNKIWGDNSNSTDDAQFNGEAFNVKNSNFNVENQNREDILVGLGFDGKLNTNWEFDAAFTYFDVIDDTRNQSDENPNDPLFDKSGRITEYDNTGWESIDIKFANDSLFKNPNLKLFTGYHFAHYSLRTDQFNSNDYTTSSKDLFRNSSGGDTNIHAIFAQSSWEFFQKWKATVGARQEWWQSYNGFKDSGSGAVNHADRDESKLSPKFSLKFEPSLLWELQFSLAQAYRFPIVEELFQNVASQNSSALSDADLKTEDGFHKTFLIKRNIEKGTIQLTFFEDDVDDVIFNQRDATTLVSTVLNIDNVRTRGIELSLMQGSFIHQNLDLNMNGSFINSKIRKNDRLPSSVGDRFPRVPKWRFNMLSTYHVTPQWDTSVGLRYTSSSFNTIPNTDTKVGFGSQNDFFVVDLKNSYRLKNGIIGSFGINNINDDEYFVFHPMPQRTFFFSLKWQF